MAAPEKIEAIADTSVLAVYGIGDVGVPTRITATGPRSVQVKLDGGWLIGAANPATPMVALKDWSL
jgi:hypothetical protein